MKAVPKAVNATNDAFHTAYGNARRKHERCSPILVILADELILRVGDERYAFPIRPPHFHILKAVAHAAVGLYVLLREADADLLRDLPPFVSRLEETVKDLSRIEGAFGREVHGLVDTARATAKRVLETGGRSATTEAHALAKTSRVALLKVTDEATKIQLDALHTAAEAALALLSSDDRAHLHVVVAGDHQARVRSVGMQYFQARLGEAPGNERRVTYGESVETEEQAMELVGTLRLDAAIASAFFGDEKRLQRDVLGDAAAHRIEEMQLEPIGE